MVLVVGESLLYHDVQHGPWVRHGHLGLLLVAGFHHKVLRKSVGEHTPDTISVQFQWPPEGVFVKKNGFITHF